VVGVHGSSKWCDWCQGSQQERVDGLRTLAVEPEVGNPSPAVPWAVQALVKTHCDPSLDKVLEILV
jgi:hypothetical protein